MTEETYVYRGDQGTRVILDTKVDLTGASTLQIKVKKADNTTATWTGAQYQTTKILYTTTTGDWSVAGRYQFQSYVVKGSLQGSGQIVAYTIKERLF